MHDKSTTLQAKKAKSAATAPPTPTSKKDTKKLKGMSFAEGESELAPPEGGSAKKPGASKGGPLGVGAEGAEVLALQRALTRFSIEAELDQDFKAELKPGPIDGKFGKSVEKALRAFQSWQNVPLTGVLDAATAAGIEYEIGFLDMVVDRGP